MNKMNRRIFNFFLLVMFFGFASSVSATTYRLQRVTSVESGQKYVFEQAGYVMNNSINSSNALQTTNSFETTGLTGAESYVWTLESASGGFKMKNNSNYLKNSSGTELSFVSSSPSVWSFSFQNDGTAIIKCVSTSRYLGGTGTSLGAYKCYTEDNLLWLCPHSVVVYQLVEEKGTSPDLSFDNAFLRFLKGESYSAPVLETAEGFDGTITYSSSNTKVATVNASTGEVSESGTPLQTLDQISEKRGDMYVASAVGTYLGVDMQIGDSIIFRNAVEKNTAVEVTDVTFVQGAVKVIAKNPTLSWDSYQA